MSERVRASITLPEALKQRASEGGNLSKTIENALNSFFEETTIHYVNTNAQYVPEDGSAIYNHGVVATYGEEKFGDVLSAIEPGDGIISYVSKSSVAYEGGARAFGVAQAPWTGTNVPEDEQVYEDTEYIEQEYHVPVKWLGVLEKNTTVTTDEIREITGRKTPQRTLETPQPEYQNGMKLLAEVILGRTILHDLL